MIFTERTITVVNDSATINKPLILYRGDKNIELKITIAESQFKFRNTDASNVIETTDASYAQLVINTPYNSPIFSDVAATKNGAVIFVITEAMIDEIREVGAYEIQIRLLDDNKQSRASIPPVSNAIEIREPIAIEDGSVVDSNAVNVAKVNRALTTTSAPLEAFDSQGNYIKNIWGDGVLITDAALNKMEAGIDGVNKKVVTKTSQLTNDANYASETFVTNKIAEAQLGMDTGYTGTLVRDNFSVDIDYGIDETSDYTTTKYKDYGVLYLPTNYAKDDNKTRLIIFCQGTGERIGSTNDPINNHGWKYFLGKGFAVMDMNGMSSDWGSAMGFPVTNQHYCNKYVLQSYKKGYDYVMAKYPYLHKEVFVAGLSMGGGSSTMITQSGIIPVIAQVGFCPAISVYKQHYMNPWGGTNQQITIAGQYGFDNWSTTTPSQSYFLANIDKVVGYDNLMANTFGLQTDKDTANNNYNNNEEYNAYCNLAKYFPVPLKIWHCTDDNTVLYRYSELFVKMVKNGGGKATLRNMGTGGHGGGWSKGSVTDIDIDGNNITTSIPFYEAVRFMLSFDNSNNDSSSGDITTATLSSISASYNQGDRVIYPSTDLVDLKIGLNVTGTYSDGTTQTLTDYTLSGNLTVGTSTITVTYKDKTCTFSVTVSAESGGGDIVDDSKLEVLTSNLDIFESKGIGNPEATYTSVMPVALIQGYTIDNTTTVCANRNIKRIDLYVDTDGVITIGKIDMANVGQSIAPVIVNGQTYNVVAGMNNIDVNISCGSTETLGFGAITDTAKAMFHRKENESAYANNMKIIAKDGYMAGGTSDTTNICYVGAIYADRLSPALAYDFRTGSLNETTGNGTAAVLSDTGTEFTSDGLHLTDYGLATITSDILGAYESYTFEMSFNIDRFVDYQIIATMNEAMSPESPNKFGVNTDAANGKLNFQTVSGGVYSDTQFNNVNYQTMTHYIFTYDLETNVKKVYMNGELLTTMTLEKGYQPETTASKNKLYLGNKYEQEAYMGTTIGIINYYSNHVVTDEEASELYTKYSSN